MISAIKAESILSQVIEFALEVKIDLEVDVRVGGVPNRSQRQTTDVDAARFLCSTATKSLQVFLPFERPSEDCTP